MDDATQKLLSATPSAATPAEPTATGPLCDATLTKCGRPQLTNTHDQTRTRQKAGDLPYEAFPNDMTHDENG
jgi:hypothetical protein